MNDFIGEDLLEDSLHKFIDGINRSTTLKNIKLKWK